MNLTQLDNLSEAEKKIALQILKQYQDTGKSNIMEQIMFDDYDEIPVDIETFIHDEKYLGRALTNDEGKFTLYPYWEKKLKELFPTNVDTNYNTVVLTGSIGTGKSTCAVIGVLYELYRLMCLKDPYLHYGLQRIDTITVAFMNITLDAAKGVAWAKCQEMIQQSDWFMSKGTINKGGTWVPPKGIELIVGSLQRHIIGRALFCLDGNTIIATTDGEKALKEVCGKEINVLSIDDNNRIINSNSCTVLPTIKSYEEYCIELEDGTEIKCTGNHLLMLKDGTYKRVDELTEEDELM